MFLAACASTPRVPDKRHSDVARRVAGVAADHRGAESPAVARAQRIDAASSHSCDGGRFTLAVPSLERIR